MDNEESTLYIRRLTVDEALWRLERFINQSYNNKISSIKVVHGKGTGKLKQAVRAKLLSDPLVLFFRSGLPEEGGEGVTIVRLM